MSREEPRDFGAEYRKRREEGNYVVRGLVAGGERHFQVVGPSDARFGRTPEQVREELFQILKEDGVDVDSRFNKGINLRLKDG